jgi:hypothetical protein
MNEGKNIDQWVRKTAGPVPTFDPQQENETYQRERKEVLGQYWGASTSSTPHIEDRVVPEKPTRKVSIIREFL